MERSAIELIPQNQMSAEELGKMLNSEDFDTLLMYLRRQIKEDSSRRFTLVADWVSVETARCAKALWDQYASRWHIESITIRATRRQYEEDVNAFESGVKWEEIQEK